MKFEEIELPSNKKFGYFFTLVFGIASTFSFTIESMNWCYIFGTLAVLFLLITTSKADLLLPLNMFWLRFGLLLGKIINPIVLGLIFFGLFTPLALMMRLFGRDELRLKIIDKSSYWVQRKTKIDSKSFNNQF